MAPARLGAAPGRRGFHASVPPPMGCTGWGPGVEKAALQASAALTLHDKPPASPWPRRPEAHPLMTVGLDGSCKEHAESLPVVRDVLIKNVQHLQSAVDRHLPRLQEEDAQLRSIQKADADFLKRATTPSAVGAFNLYCTSLHALDAGPDSKKKAFQAVAHGDEDTLVELFEQGKVQLDVLNQGGYSLLDIARQRELPGMISTLEMLMRMKQAEDEQREFQTPDDGILYAPEQTAHLLVSGSIKYLLVSVKARNDVNVALFTRTYEPGAVEAKGQFYVFVIGSGNDHSRNFLKRGMDGEIKVETKAKLLSAMSFKDFWFSVDTTTNRVAMGKGRDITQAVLLEYTDAAVMAPVSFAVSTRTTGTWRFPTKSSDDSKSRPSGSNPASPVGRTSQATPDRALSRASQRSGGNPASPSPRQTPQPRPESRTSGKAN